MNKKNKEKKMKVMSMLATALVCVSTVFAIEVDQLKGLPRGVQSIKYENGVISTLVVVGKAAVPKALQRNIPRAAQYGGEKARTEAFFEFTRFLSTKCKWGKTSNGETAVAEAAASATDANGKETATENSTFNETEMTKEQKAQSAQACVSAIQALWEGLNDSGEYVWVGAWNAKALNSIKDIVQKNKDINNEINGTPAPGAKPGQQPKKPDTNPNNNGKGVLPTPKTPEGKPANDVNNFF